MYLAGVSVRRVEDITEALWGSKVSPSTISELNKKAYANIEIWRNRSLSGSKYPYVYVVGTYLKRNWGGEYENVVVLVAIAVNEDGYREVLGAAEGMKEDKADWVNSFQWLYGCGLDGLNSSLETSVWACWKRWEKCIQRLSISAALSTFIEMCSLWFPDPKEKRLPRCSRRFMSRKTNRQPERRPNFIAEL